MPPENVLPLNAIAVLVAVMLLWLSSLIPPAMAPVLAMEPEMVPLVKTTPPGLIVPSLVILPVKLVLVTQTPAAVDALGLSKLALTLTQAANAGGAPPPIRTAASEVEASHQPRRAGRPGPEPIRTLP